MFQIFLRLEAKFPPKNSPISNVWKLLTSCVHCKKIRFKNMTSQIFSFPLQLLVTEFSFRQINKFIIGKVKHFLASWRFKKRGKKQTWKLKTLERSKAEIKQDKAVIIYNFFPHRKLSCWNRALVNRCITSFSLNITVST